MEEPCVHVTAVCRGEFIELHPNNDFSSDVSGEQLVQEMVYPLHAGPSWSS